jgi:hypothetical protein
MLSHVSPMLSGFSFLFFFTSTFGLYSPCNEKNDLSLVVLRTNEQFQEMLITSTSGHGVATFFGVATS